MSASPMPNGHSNGHAESSSSADSFDNGSHHSDPDATYPQNGLSHLPLQSHNDDLVNYLYHSGFQTGNYADTILQVQQHSYRLHAIILSRSPFLAHLMSTSPTNGGQRVIYVPLEQEPEVTQEGFAIALGYLYSSISLTLIRPENCRAVLAAGRLLGGMEDLCQYAYEECRRSISLHTINSWLVFVDSLPASSSDGTATPVVPTNTVFGQYAQKLRDDVFHFLVVTLPEILEVHSPQDTSSTPSGRQVLLQIFAQVPFEMFKSAVESSIFNIGSDQARFKFAKDAIELRKRGIARVPGAEETVVLAFGGNNFGGSAVHITRKLKKRPLWKVNS
nr:NPR4 [Flammulina filiformis]